jgi:two-component system sensor histidine kinase QseC
VTGRAASLQARLLLLVLGVVTAVWLAAAARTWFDVRHELGELLDGHLAQAAALLVVQQAQVPEDGDGDRGVDAPTLHRYAPKVAFQVFHEGRLALRSANAPATPMVGTGRGHESGFSTVQIDGTAWRVFATFGAERDVQVHVGEQESSRAAILRAVLRNTLLPLAVALPLLAWAAWWAVKRGVAPLRRLGTLLAARQPRALEPVRVDDAPAEMQPLVEALNGLLERTAVLMEAERRFTADAAHELRTPLAAIRTQAQVALAETADAPRRHALQSVLAGCDRAARLVDQLLTLSRLEAGTASAPGRADLAAVARSVVADLAPQALAKGQTIELEAAAPCPVQADATLLAVLVRNLVDNAIRYSPPAAAVKLILASMGAGASLQVADSGPGLAEPELQRLGERFFRVLGSGEAGSGLGWSIVRRIAAVQGAQVAVARSAALGGLEVTVEWPPLVEAR